MALSGIALVTGGAGFIGSHIASALASVGRESSRHRRSLHRLSREPCRDSAAMWISFRAVVADESVLRKRIEDVELVFHEAAIPSVPRSVENPRQTHIASVESTFSLLVGRAREQSKRDWSMRPQVRLTAISRRCRKLRRCCLSRCLRMPWPNLWASITARSLPAFMVSRLFRCRYFNVFGPRQDPSSQYSGVVSRFISDSSWRAATGDLWRR